MERLPTIADVARACGVSMRTVSRVINGARNVKPATRVKIEQEIERLKFRPNPQARGLAASRSYLLGLVYDMPNALYLDTIQRGITGTCRSSGYELVIHPCESTGSDTVIADTLSFVRRSNIDGLIVLPPVSEMAALPPALDEAGVDYVLLASVDLVDPVHLVRSAERLACEDMTRHLIELGHRDIAFISGPSDYRSTRERLEGFRDAFRAAGLALNEELILKGDYGYHSGYSAGNALFSRRQKPTAIFASNDEMAFGVFNAAAEAGMSVPNDVSVCGFDDVVFAERTLPSLTTIRRPSLAMASLATEKLIALIEGRDDVANRMQAVVPLELILRNSTAARR
ncbi:LacI family DNA-binding transcriptional regulator [Parvularcula flava]|uniref:LacI family DNA-binding transcriptional regulator n=1 Tax=Aquisalinus luteolus TaxID=1566827 RepID=A0ABX0HEG7_9PROT|nr:LacI family DNA-binding transcriptional regulator [Aquisalinus luteolus]